MIHSFLIGLVAGARAMTPFTVRAARMVVAGAARGPKTV